MSILAALAIITIRCEVVHRVYIDEGREEVDRQTQRTGPFERGAENAV